MSTPKIQLLTPFPKTDENGNTHFGGDVYVNGDILAKQSDLPCYSKPMEQILAPTTLIPNEENYINIPLIVGEPYRVICNDKEYKYVSKKMSVAEGVEIIYIGNLNVIGGDAGIGEPFVILNSNGATAGYATEEAIVSIYSFTGKKVQVLPETKIPEDIFYEFVSPVLFNVGDVIYARCGDKTLCGTFYMDNGTLTAWLLRAGTDNVIGIATTDGYNYRFAYQVSGYPITGDTFEIFQLERDKIPDECLPKPDDALSSTSERPVQNKVLAQIIAELTARLEALEGN